MTTTPKERPIQWVVLIQKSPHGPFPTDVVKTLIDQKVLRMNDVALKVPGPDEPKATEWHFLWQYDEFDRRKGQDRTDYSRPAPEEERRQETPEPVKTTALAELPLDLVSITPDELVIRAKTTPRENLREMTFDSEREPQGTRLPNSAGHPGRWVAGAVGALGLSVASFYFLMPSGGMLPAPPTASAPSEPTPSVSQVPTGTPLGLGAGTSPRQPARLPVAPPPPPLAPMPRPQDTLVADPGEIAPPPDREELDADGWRNEPEEELDDTRPRPGRAATAEPPGGRRPALNRPQKGPPPLDDEAAGAEALPEEGEE